MREMEFDFVIYPLKLIITVGLDYKTLCVCQFCNMSLGFKVGEDEHAAYIAGFAGDCVSEFINSKNTD